MCIVYYRTVGFEKLRKKEDTDIIQHTDAHLDSDQREKLDWYN